ncbi:MAG: response regulator [Candidatus Omnitrophota bacterium]
MNGGMFKYVIVMDSDLDRRDSFYNVLVQSNYKVTTVPSYSELITIIKKERPNYIIIDLDTLEEPVKGTALKQLRDIDSSTKIIVLVSELAKEKVNIQKSVDDKIIFLNKDVQIQQILQSILDILKEKDIEKKEGEITFNGSILIVDDEHESNSLVGNHLSRRGYIVDNAFSGEEALLKVKVTKPKVVILDILMPGMDGLVILNRIKEIDSSIFVIVTSGIENDKSCKTG